LDLPWRVVARYTANNRSDAPAVMAQCQWRSDEQHLAEKEWEKNSQSQTRDANRYEVP